MAGINPFQAIMGRMMPQAPQMPQATAQGGQTGNQLQPDWNALMGQLQANPSVMLKQAGYNVPDELNGNPQAMVMHLMQSGQIGGPMMQKIQPFLQRMGIR